MERQRSLLALMPSYKQLLVCGGVVGHLSHLYDNRELTFGEIKDVLTMAGKGKLKRVTEKLDGQNLVFTYDLSSNDLRVARNSGNIKQGGLDAGALASKFAGRGNLTDAFNGAFRVLRQALSSLTDDVKTQVFGDHGQTWYSMEIIYTENPNVINYDSNNIVFHGWPVFNLTDDGKIEKSDGSGVDILSQHIEKMQNAVAERNWRINGPRILDLKKISDGNVLQRTLSKLGEIQAQAGVSDSGTIKDYLLSMAMSELASTSRDLQRNDVALKLIDDPEAPHFNDIKKNLEAGTLPAITDLFKRRDKLLKKWIRPLELLINEFAIEVLKGLSSTLISTSDKEVGRLRAEVQHAIAAIESSGDEKSIETLKLQLQKLGSIENINTPMEGVVFMYKGNAYKFTGSFAAMNGILGMLKYGR